LRQKLFPQPGRQPPQRADSAGSRRTFRQRLRQRLVTVEPPDLLDQIGLQGEIRAERRYRHLPPFLARSIDGEAKALEVLDHLVPRHRKAEQLIAAARPEADHPRLDPARVGVHQRLADLTS
jgi:hypothetical protein